MKKAPLKIGTKTAKAMVAMVDVAENAADCLELAADDESFMAQMFMRGYSIYRQDAVARPMFVDGATGPEIQEALDNLVGRGERKPRVKAPKIVTLPKQATYTEAEVAAILARSGINVVTQ